MVNYKRIVCEAAVLAVVIAVAVAAPAADCADRHFDQRQNGTENYRLNIDGVVIAVAPADSLLAAASDIDISDLLDLEDFGDLPVHKPKPPSSESNKPEVTKPETPPKPADDPVKPVDSPAKPAEAPLSDVTLQSEVKSQKKDSSLRKQEKAQRLKQRLANMLIPLLRRTRHH
uniref:Cuticular protein n=1 Tax=Papilio polytes TaxID=76194 RepID=I4DML0_PAPPL|nr:unknown secreted protein [Papilio polytes]